ncbi:MAG: polysaccharide deacetylase family protein [Bacteroides sp.]|nr:polysaccharide deacetylase family protein [Bacteroides sp.]MCM1555789.1 polysaccharide deacetylase family protein [Bacteroides sp.]
MSIAGYISIAVAVLLSAFGYYASFFIGSGVYVKALCRAVTKEREIALTFDDGPDEVMTARVLDVLKRHRVQAAFFLIGEKAQAHPGLVRRMVEEGHIIGSHSFFHTGCFPFESRKKMERELMRTRETLYEITGKKIRLFRPPFGVTNPHVAAVVRQGGYRTIGWSVRAFDTRRRVPRLRILKRLVAGLHPGAVVLLHDRCLQADELLENFIAAAHGKGYRFVSPDKLLNIQAYEA